MDFRELHPDERAVDIMGIFAHPTDRIDLALADQLVDADMLEGVVDADHLLADMKFIAHGSNSQTAIRLADL
ncbi:hypothetical protein REMIM1_CH02572 [Rhizobium etli bv. mimosae str. Mim1]|nr:hypothetical protein REMIM1_CH02572 [Rhizobium etli bv. mimosae str. Mim1]